MQAGGELPQRLKPLLLSDPQRRAEARLYLNSKAVVARWKRAITKQGRDTESGRREQSCFPSFGFAKGWGTPHRGAAGGADAGAESPALPGFAGAFGCL